MKFIIVFLFSSTLLFSQSNLDSLLNSISGKPDTAQVRILTDYCWIYRSKNPRDALRSGEEAAKIAKSIQNKKLEAKALNLTGVVYRNLGNYDKALDIYKNALRIAEDAKDSIQIAYSNNNIGGIYRLEGNNTLALDYILKALKVFENIGNKSGISFCTINIGLIYNNQENYIKALEYLNYTLRIRNAIGDQAGKALALNLIAEVYYKMNEIHVALKYYDEAEKEYIALDDKKGLAAIWGGIGGVYFSQNNLQKALEYRLRALDLSSKISYAEGQVTNLNNLALIYAKMGKAKEAEENLKKAQSIATNLKAAYLELNCYRSWSDYSELKGDYKKALFYTKKFIALKDSVMSQENIALVGSMEVAYKSEKTEKENAILLKNNEIQKKQRNYLVVIALLVIIIAVITYNRYRAKKSASEKYRELNAIKDKFFKIIAHDLRTPFNTILGYTEILREDFSELSDDEKLALLDDINKSAKQSYQLLENLLVWSQTQTGNIDFDPKELDLSGLLKETVSVLESTAKNKNISLEVSCTPDLKITADEQMLETVIRNLVMNSIKFTEHGKISIVVKEEPRDIKIIVEDTGEGIDETISSKLFQADKFITTHGTRGEKGTGLGLILCKEFIEKHNGKIWVESKLGEGSKFIFTIPRSIF